MNISLACVLRLLHQAAFGSLATHSIHMPGYPFTSVLPFAPDENHRPLFLISLLAEHTKNLLADGRASFLVHESSAPSVLAGERATLLGDVEQLDASPELVARYLRYQPEAQRYLALGDFAFFRLLPRRVRYIGGFGKMGWIEQTEWANAAVLSLAAEKQMMERLAPGLAPRTRLLGIDRYGLDLEQDDARRRRDFTDAPLAPETVLEAARLCLHAP